LLSSGEEEEDHEDEVELEPEATLESKKRGKTQGRRRGRSTSVVLFEGRLESKRGGKKVVSQCRPAK